ncbi:Blp family class II bacteriocin [Leuconostoc miyukkimchii]|uniref:Blp family class II bacteriocin n=1 Tax=Leuconostoc miyukkimchii TaxID=910540 RepID=UPI001FE842FC|nr:Blp family class II bacteriocin [Leuconostoc miyukkimchii]
MISDFEPINVEKLETIVGGVMTGRGLAKAIGAGALGGVIRGIPGGMFVGAHVGAAAGAATYAVTHY